MGMELMKNLLILIMSLMLAGCFYQAISSEDIKLAQMYCEGSGGIDEIREHATGLTEIVCLNADAAISEEYAAKFLVLRKLSVSKFTKTNTSCDYKPIRQPGEAQTSYDSRKLAYHLTCVIPETPISCEQPPAFFGSTYDTFSKIQEAWIKACIPPLE